MLAVFYGTDRTAVRNATSTFLATNAPNVGADSLDHTNYLAGELPTLIDSQSLFGGTEVYILDTPSNDSEFDTEVLEHLSDMAASQNIFVVMESSLLTAQKKKYERHASEVGEFAAEKPDRFNAFALGDALAKRDKKNLWVLLQEAKLAGLRPEEIAGVLWWQLKALRLAEQTANATEAGMKDYPYKKAKQSLRNFKPGEITERAQSLLVLYHESHQGLADMESRLEAWALTV